MHDDIFICKMHFEKRLCMKTAGWERFVFFDLFKKYFPLNYCYNFASHLVRGTNLFLFFFLLLCVSVVHLISDPSETSSRVKM